MENSLLHDRPLFQPDDVQIACSQMTDFISYCTGHTGQSFANYASFEKFCRTRFRLFWQLFLAWSKISTSGDAAEVCRGDACETAQFFPDLHLNYAEVLLDGHPDAPAILACHKGSPAERLTRRDLSERVAGVSELLSHLGVMPGDRVVAIARNNAEVIIAALACASVGAAFSSCATDMGVESICLRFEPLKPVVLFANLDEEEWDVGEPLHRRVGEVLHRLPTARALIALDGGGCSTELPLYHLEDCKRSDSVWQRFPFNHPLFILFSSGTTGAPKCIIHGAGGTVLEHIKEHRLHCDMRYGDSLYFQTSCGWMMWNWQLSALASGVELVLYDGPMDSPETLWRLIAENRVTLFGTNPAYLQFCEMAGCQPWQFGDFDHLRALFSTGSILYPHQFDWILQQVKPLPMQSISGGTDIIGCFVLGNPNLPVYRGEAQCRSLGLDIMAVDTTPEGVGELICANPFPSRPLGFLNDDGTRFHAAYFAQNRDVWTHGDLIEFTCSGGAILHGRSDGVLNIRGIRIGPAEIYRLLQGIPSILEAMAVEQKAEDEPGGSRLILLVVLRKALDAALAAHIRHHLMTNGVAVMVPTQIIQVDALPMTHSGKRSEAAARDAVNGRPLRNRDALRNPDCLDLIAQRLSTEHVNWPREEPNELLETWLQRVCQQTYGVPRIEWSDNLLQFGDSLTFLNLYLELGRVLGRCLPWLTTTPTIVRLAAIIRNEHVADAEGTVIRPATHADFDSVHRLLRAGFPDMPPDAWNHLFNYAWAAQVPPTYGFVLEADGMIVGYLGAVYAQRTIHGKTDQVCNLTSWYIAPAYRGWGAAMLSTVLAFDSRQTYTVLTAAPLPKAICRGMQFTEFVDSSLALLPLQHPHTLMQRPQISFQPKKIRPHLATTEQRILDDHVATDCLHVLVQAGYRQAYMVVKRRRYRLRPWLPRIPASKVLYCGAPDFVAKHLEWIKLAILLRQRTVALVVSARCFRIPPSGMRFDSHMLMRSDVFEPSDLDLLYSEVCLLPV